MLTDDTKLNYTVLGRPNFLDTTWKGFRESWAGIIPVDDLRRMGEELEAKEIAKFDVLTIWVDKP